MTLYNIKTRDSTFVCTKFDDDLNPIVGSSYEVSEVACTCPAGQRPTCRHRHMLDIFTTQGAVDQPAFYNYDAGAWHDEAPLPEPPTADELDIAEMRDGVERDEAEYGTEPKAESIPQDVADQQVAVYQSAMRRRNIV